jgi:hypothetical protein
MTKERQNQWLQVTQEVRNSWGPARISMKKEGQNYCLKGDRNNWGSGHISMKKEGQNNCLKGERNNWGSGHISMKKERQNNGP